MIDVKEDVIRLKKNLSLNELAALRTKIEDVNFWTNLCPNSSISNFSVKKQEGLLQQQEAELKNYQSLLSHEGYFQAHKILPDALCEEMRECIENVKNAGLPVMFALVYDVFFEAFQYFNSILEHTLGEEYKLIPNFWVYYIDTTDESKGFEPHRDLEYTDTIDADGNPQVLTLWITITDATPLNSCMYVVPAHRDPDYKKAIHDLDMVNSSFKLEDARAVPIEKGSLSAWDQYIYHWGSRGSKRAQCPRISYALYCQRGDIAAVDANINLKTGIDFETRLALICRGVHRYSQVASNEGSQTPEVLDFLNTHRLKLQKT